MPKAKTKQREALEKVDLIEMLKTYTSYEIAEIFNTNYSTVEKVSNEQHQHLTIEEAARRSRIAKLNVLNKEDDLICNNAWFILKNSDVYKQLTKEDEEKND